MVNRSNYLLLLNYLLALGRAYKRAFLGGFFYGKLWYTGHMRSNKFTVLEKIKHNET